MANVRKPIIENTVYSEILYRLGVHKYYVNQFVEHFKDDDIDIDPNSFELKKTKPHKEQSVLQRQMELLRKEGYLLTTKIDDKGNKVDKNKKLYYIDFKKIIDAFIDYAISRLKIKHKNKQLDTQELKKHLIKLTNKKWRTEAKSNTIIRYFFSAFVEEMRRRNYDHRKLTLKEMFDAILSSSYIHDTIKYELYARDNEAKIPQNETDEFKLIKKNLVSEYHFYIEFMDSVSQRKGMIHFVNQHFPIEISGKLFSGFDKHDFSFYRLKD